MSPYEYDFDEQFHRLTVEGRPARTGGPPPPPLKEYPTAPSYALPDPLPLPIPLHEALQQRRSLRTYKPDFVLPLAHLATLLHYTVGVTHLYRDRYPLRAYPSAGALHPLELYVYARQVADLPAGIFHYHPLKHRLYHLVEGEIQEALVQAAYDQEFLADAAAVLIFAIVYERTRRKYGYRAYRYVFTDLGAACENTYLVACGLGLGTVLVGAFDDDAVATLIGLDPEKEWIGALMPVGEPLSR